MVSEGEGSGEIGRAVFRRTIDAGLEGIALAATEPLRQAPVGAGAGEREAHHSVWREAIVEAGRAACCPCREIMAADHGEIAAGAVAAAEACAPYRQARLIHRCRLGRCLEYLGIGERDVLRQVFALGRKTECRVIGAADTAAAVDEWIKHQVQELIGELEADLLRVGGSFAGQLAQRVGKIAAGEAEDSHEGGRQRAAAVEEVVERISDVTLVDAEAAAERAWPTWPTGLAERGGEVQDRVGCSVAE